MSDNPFLKGSSMDALKRFKNGDVIVSIVEWCQDEALRELNRQRLIDVEYHGIGFRRLKLTFAGEWKLIFDHYEEKDER